MPKRFHYKWSKYHDRNHFSLARLPSTSEYCSRLYGQNEQYTHIFLISVTPIYFLEMKFCP